MRFLSLFHWLCLQRQVWWQRQNETNSRILLTLLLMDDGVKVCPRYPTFEQCFYLFRSVAKIHCNLDFRDHSKAVLRHHFLLQNSRYGGSAPMGLATQASMFADLDWSSRNHHNLDTFLLLIEWFWLRQHSASPWSFQLLWHDQECWSWPNIGWGWQESAEEEEELKHSLGRLPFATFQQGNILCLSWLSRTVNLPKCQRSMFNKAISHAYCQCEKLKLPELNNPASSNSTRCHLHFLGRISRLDLKQWRDVRLTRSTRAYKSRQS